MARDLTVKSIEALKPGPVRREVPDGRVRGLFLVVQPTGAMSWAYRYRAAGRPRKLTLGAYPAIDIPSARRLAAKAATEVAEGRDPGTTKVETRRQDRETARAEASQQTDRIEHVVQQFIARHVQRKNRASTVVEVSRLLRVEVVGPWGARRLPEITRADVHNLLDRIVDRGAPITANRTFAALRKLCNWCIERGIVETSPCERVKAPAAEKSRDRVLADDEIRLIWRAFEAAGYPFGAMGRMLVLTAARRDEVAKARWSELDLEARVWTLPGSRSKNGREHQLPLSPQLMELLKGLPRRRTVDGKPSPFLFTTSGVAPVSGFSKFKQSVDAYIAAALAEQGPEARMLPWVLHDLRRTAASGMAGLGIAPHIVEACLNHRSGTIKGVAAIYNRYSYSDEKRAALEAWARRVDEIVTGRRPDNVVDLATVRAS